MASNKEVSKLIRQIRAIDGASVSTNRGKHFTVNYQGRRCGTMPPTPSDVRWKRNLISQLRRNGFPTHLLNTKNRSRPLR